MAPQGTAADPGLYVFNGAIAPDRVVQGSTKAFGSNMVLIYSTSSSTATPAVVAVSKIGAGAQSAPVTLKTSSGSDIDFTCSGVGSTCRWGDYAGAVSDTAAPATGTEGVIYAVNMYPSGGTSTAQSNWNTWLTELTP